MRLRPVRRDVVAIWAYLRVWSRNYFRLRLLFNRPYVIKSVKCSLGYDEKLGSTSWSFLSLSNSTFTTGRFCLFRVFLPARVALPCRLRVILVPSLFPWTGVKAITFVFSNIVLRGALNAIPFVKRYIHIVLRCL